VCRDGGKLGLSRSFPQSKTWITLLVTRLVQNRWSMAIFAVLLPTPQPAVVEAIKKAYPNDYLPVNETQWLISTTGTASEVTKKIGVYDPAAPQAPFTGNAIVFSTNGYFGRAPSNVWEWIKAKLEATPSG
jgi:hypothetical protein